jgi:hypothetical protein
MVTQRRRQKNGVVMIYVLLAMSAMMGFCSLAVDFARVESAKTELRRAADAAALYACQGIANGTAVTKAIQSGNDNKVDGTPLTILPGDVTVGTWSGGTFTAGGSSPNAVRVQAYRTKARSSAISLVFAQLIGQSSCDVTTTAIAEITTSDSTQYVAATSNPYLAGEPTGTRASVPDPGYKGPQVNPEHPWQYDWAGPTGSKLPSGQAYGSPVQFPVSLTPGTVLQLTDVTGMATNDPTLPLVNSNGQLPTGGDLGIYDDEAAEATGSEHGMSNIEAPLNSFIGVFLDNNVPDNDGPIPPELNFSSSTEQNYTSISPELRQPFYIGNGQTSNGQQQSVVVPPGATRFYIATMDGHEWSNNVGGFTATISTSNVRLVQ